MVGQAAMTDAELRETLKRLEEMLSQLIESKTHKEYYSTAEVAEIVGKSEFTVREWCRHRRVRAEKAASGRGREWRISHEELQRIRSYGPLPLTRRPTG